MVNMLKNNKTAAFLVIITILFPVFHHETASHVLNGGKSTSKNALKIKCNIYNSNIKVSKRITKINDIDLCYNEIPIIIPEFVVQIISTDSLQFRTLISKYSFWSKATFS
jgi:hypothetical protein